MWRSSQKPFSKETFSMKIRKSSLKRYGDHLIEDMETFSEKIWASSHRRYVDLLKEVLEIFLWKFWNLLMILKKDLGIFFFCRSSFWKICRSSFERWKICRSFNRRSATSLLWGFFHRGYEDILKRELETWEGLQILS